MVQTQHYKSPHDNIAEAVKRRMYQDVSTSKVIIRYKDIFSSCRFSFKNKSCAPGQFKN